MRNRASKTNGQTFQRKKQMHMQFGKKRTDKHFQKQQNAVWRKNERAIDAPSESQQVDSFRHCNLVQPSSKLAAGASIRNWEQAYFHQLFCDCILFEYTLIYIHIYIYIYIYIKRTDKKIENRQMLL